MRAGQHVVISAGVAGVLWVAFRSWEMALACLLAGIFMDVDHLIEYVREYGLRPDLRQFFRVSYEREYDKAVLLLHAWEWLPVLVFLVWRSHGNPWLTGLAIGWIQHLACDQAANTRHWGAYFIAWRWKHRFDHDTFFSRRDAS
jgi:hypothetical protein